MKDQKKNKTKNIFDWLQHITWFKTPVEEFTDKDWENFNSYMVHRFISMNLYYAEVAAYAQSLMPDNKKEIYNFYKEMIPKRKVWLKYIKSKNKSNNKELIKILADYFKLGTSEIPSYINILGNKKITEILREMGIEEKEAKKLLKK
jgi:hypothetical protein|tara:strand:- start:760 stop:1200 length:441 start_codon:yes stop_codon:yes gene_type:complete